MLDLKDETVRTALKDVSNQDDIEKVYAKHGAAYSWQRLVWRGSALTKVLYESLVCGWKYERISASSEMSGVCRCSPPSARDSCLPRNGTSAIPSPP